MSYISDMGQQMGGFQPAPGMPGVSIGYEDPYTLTTGQMPPAAGSPGTGGKAGGPNIPGAVIEQPFIPPGQGSPGMGGKGGNGPLSQIPIDMSGNVLGTDQPPMPTQPSMGGLPPAPIATAPLAKTTGGTTGRPSPSAPMVPRGPGFNNPGAPGAPPQQPMERSLLTPPQVQPQPFQGGQQNRLQPARPAPAVRPAIPRQTPTVARPVNLTRRGAGRGGMLR